MCIYEFKHTRSPTTERLPRKISSKCNLREMRGISESFPMTGGDGPYSYAKNSNLQKEGAEEANAMLAAWIVENLEIAEQASPSAKAFRIADLGCSIGPNTFIAVKNIMDAIKHKFHIQGQSSRLPDFQVFFNDHVSNDFNTLFINLPPNEEYFAAGVPGSFHGRLFPTASLDFVYSSFALQWLSKAPPELSDINSLVRNEGRIHYLNAPIQVGDAYAAQYSKDMETFLRARAQELAPGGLMALIIPGRADGTLPTQSGVGDFFHPLQSCLVDMVNEGIISKAKLDSFNLPLYRPSQEELHMLIKKAGCFDTVILKNLKQELSKKVMLALIAIACRVGFEGMIKIHFGSEIIEELFDRCAKKVVACPSLRAGDQSVNRLFILLKRPS